MSKEILFCPICESPFSSQKIPRIFPQCKHSLCQTCLLTLLKTQSQSNPKLIRCPIDNQDIELQDRSLHHFPKNFSLMKSLVKRNSGLSGARSRTSLFSDRSSRREGSGKRLEEEIGEMVNIMREGEQEKDMNKEERKDKSNGSQKNAGSMELIVLDMIQKIEKNILDQLEEIETKQSPFKQATEQIVAQEQKTEAVSPKSQPITVSNLPKNTPLPRISPKPQSHPITSPRPSKSKPPSLYSKKDSIRQNSRILKDKNQSSQSSISKQDFCLAHDKLLDVVCIKDSKLICSACALFGDHKGHNIKSIHELRKDIVDREKSILKMIEDKEMIGKQVESGFSDQAIMKLVITKKEKVGGQIREHIKKTVEKLLEEEKRCMTALDKEADQLFKVLKKEVNPLYSKFQEIKNCEARSLQILEILESDISVEKKVAYLNYSKKPDFVDKTTNSLTEIRQLKKAIAEKNLSVINKMNIKFKNFDFKGIVVFYKQRTSLQLAYEPILNQVHDKSKMLQDNIQQQLLIELQKQKGSNSPSQYPSPNQSISGLGYSLILNDSMAFDANNTVSSLPITHSMIRQVKSPASKLMPKKSISISMSHKPLLKSSSNSKMLTTHVTPRALRSVSKVSQVSSLSKPKSKAVKFKLPQKYQKLYNNLCMDTLEILDLTFAELGNQSVTFVLEQLEGKKVKVIKLVRNKLTDDILKDLWKNMKHIQSLNLSQNLFSDKIVDSFLKNVNKLESMKSITLSQNKINSRTVKSELQQIKKKNITISL